MESIVNVRHDSQTCECCLDFWGAPEPQDTDKEQAESDADSGYCSITRKDAQYTSGTRNPVAAVMRTIPVVPRIIVTPLSDDEQIQHNACIRASLLQRNAFTTITQEEKSLPSSTTTTTAAAARSTCSLPATIHTSSRPSLSPPEESWAHRLKDTYDNRMAYPQYFTIQPPVRKRPSKTIEKHPAAMPVPTTCTQSVRKRWSISGSGVGFTFGKMEPEIVPVVKPRRTVAPTPTTDSSVKPASTPSESTPLKRRARVTSTRSLDKPSSSPSPSPPPSRPTSMILTSTSGNALGLGKWANSATGNGPFGKSVQGMKSFIGRYSNAPSSFRML